METNGAFTAAAIQQGSTDAMPPPRATRSTTAQLPRKNIQGPDGPNSPLTDLDEPTTPLTKSAPGRKKLPVDTRLGHLG